jgi:hypothetical protein
VLTQTLPTGKLSSPSATRTSATLAHREPQRATGELFITSTKAQRRHALRGSRTGLTSNPFHPARTNHTVGDEAEQTDSNGKDTQRPCGHRSRPLTYARADRAEDNTTNTTNTHSSNTNRLQKSSVGSTHTNTNTHSSKHKPAAKIILEEEPSQVTLADRAEDNDHKHNKHTQLKTQCVVVVVEWWWSWWLVVVVVVVAVAVVVVLIPSQTVSLYSAYSHVV